MLHRSQENHYLRPFLLITFLLSLSPIFSSSAVKADQPGPMLLRDFNRTTGRASFLGGTFYQGKLYFAAYDTDLGNGLWRTDGTPQGTEVIYNGVYPTTLSPYDITTRESVAPAELNNVLYFGTENFPDSIELWRTDGTTEGTYLVKRIVSEAGSAFIIGEPVGADGFIWFPVHDNNFIHNQLWRSDGTENGTVKVADYSIPKMAVLNGIGIFPYGSGLMRTRSDGNIEQFATVDSERWWSMYKFISTNGWLYFSGAIYDSSSPLLVTDGETVAIIKQAGTGDIIYNTRYMVLLGNELYFSGSVTGWVSGLWKLPIGSTEALLVKEFSLGGIGQLTELSGTIFFRHYFGGDGEVKELWKSDGTNEGTQQVCASCNLTVGEDLIASQKWLYFANKDTAHGYELWITDGTDAGTHLFRDINPGLESSYPTYMFADDKMLVFSSDDGQHGFEPWGFSPTFNQSFYLPVIQR